MAPETVIIAAAVVCAVLVLVMVKLTRHFVEPQPIPMTADWIDALSIDVDDIVRLLGEEDCPSLRTHLPHLRDDFRRICMAVKVIIVQSNCDRPDLARVLMRNQMTFAYRMMRARFRLGARITDSTGLEEIVAGAIAGAVSRIIQDCVLWNT